MDLLRKLLGVTSPPSATAPRSTDRRRPARPPYQPRTLTVADLVDRLRLDETALRSTLISYRTFTVPKRGGGLRHIAAPDRPLRDLQRRILRRLLARLQTHPAAVGFEPGESTVSHAAEHVGRPVVLRMDVRNFFSATSATRVRQFFAEDGWDRSATDLLVRLTTHNGALPQGAPTSPRLSNLVNRRLDARLNGLAVRNGATYTRYADDLTFSFETDDPLAIHDVIRQTKYILADDGYELHERRKLHIRRQHERQLVGGLVVNVRPAIPRDTLRWLRAVEHRLATGGQPTITPAQLDGWRAYRSMVDRGPSAAADSTASSALS